MKSEACTYALSGRSIDFEDKSNLKCPHCGFYFLHQIECRALWRAEDSDGTCHTSAHQREGRETIPKNDIAGRRDLIEIDFECENCSGIKTMYIQQHKGSTYMGWVNK